ncbi:M3 family metallopeptidase [Hallella colorans]|uniref:M3 family metallopeptidase n=1 Tax=Hallella colorans TaxID=1703337 RepID=UPI0023F5407D|nr:M3 family metallopeptidase [Hallella colorans]
MNQPEIKKNPFMEPYETLHDTVPFDKIKFEHYEEAFMEGIRRDNESIAKIVENPDTPTFRNTIAVEDDSKGKHYYDLLDRVSTVFSCMMSANTNDKMEELAQKISPILTQHGNDLIFNKKLFERVKYVHDHHEKLTPEEQTLLDKEYDAFVRSGALLGDTDKERLRKLTEEAGILTLQFSQNLLKENKAYTLHITDKADLEGLPDTAIEAAAAAAKEKNMEGWLFTLVYPSYSPFMSYAKNRDLREQMYMARNTECIKNNDENNLKICQRLINLRREMAQLIGYETYADYVLKHRMAGSTRRVYKLLDDLIEAYKPKAIEELNDIKAKARTMEGENFELKPWDFSYYAHKLQMEKFNLDAEMLRPYFQLDKVVEGVFGLANKLYGISFKENKEIPVYHPDVKAYEVFDEDGSFLAVFYADFYPRDGKQGGAWMTEFQGQYINSKGENIRPHVSVVMNLTKPTASKPALLTMGEVETFLHEFGHSLHGMLANTRFESLSGTNVWWDFVEMPSQFMENYSTEKDFLRTFAFHYKTGEPIPDELIDRIRKSRNFNVAYACLRQVSFGLLDMAYYTQKTEFKEDIIPFEKKAWDKAMVAEQLPNTCMTTQFSHIMAGGYAAGYYSYKWAEVLDADAFSVFKKNGIFDHDTAKRLRSCVLSKGGTENPMTLYKRFRGQEPTIDALLVRNGIKEA